MRFSLLLTKALSRFFAGTLDTLFPIFCLGCDHPGIWLCDRCREKIPLRLIHRCPSCRKHTTPSGRTCSECSESYPLDGIFAAAHYKIPLLSHAIHTYKYRFADGLSVPLAELLADALDRTDLPLPDVIIPVPLHPRRLRFRGFNQSALLAEHLSRSVAPGIALPILPSTLLRARHTKPQMKTRSRSERLKNLKSAFTLERKTRKELRGKNIWLIDDVATTGTTLEECARVLREAGAHSVFGIVIAR